MKNADCSINAKPQKTAPNNVPSKSSPMKKPMKKGY